MLRSNTTGLLESKVRPFCSLSERERPKLVQNRVYMVATQRILYDWYLCATLAKYIEVMDYPELQSQWEMMMNNNTL